MKPKDIYIPLFRNKKYCKFIIAGGLATATNLGALFVLHGIFSIPVVLASSISFIISFFVSFSLQKFWTFAGTTSEGLKSQAAKYFLTSLFGLALNATGMHLLVERLEIFYLLAQIIMAALIAIMNYLIYRMIFGAISAERIKHKERRKWLIATGIYPPDPGGPASYVSTLRNELPARGIDLEIVTYGEMEDSDVAQNIFRISRKQNVVSRYLGFFAMLWKRAASADLIYVQGPVSEGLPAYFAARLRRKPYVLKVVGDFAWEQGSQRCGVMDMLDDFQEKTYGPKVELWRLIQIFVAHGAETVIVPSAYLKSIVEKWGVASERIKVIYNAMPAIGGIMDKDEARRSLGIGGRTIVSVGRLVPWKGFASLITALSGLPADVCLKIIGDGPEREKLERIAQGAGLDGRVTFTGTLTREETLRYLRAADLFVLYTAYEGLSHVLIEALSLGTPVLTTAVGGNPELFSEEGKKSLLPYGDQAALEAALAASFTEYGKTQATASHAAIDIAPFRRERMINDLVETIL